jgi:hypothetical protein
LGVHDGRRPGWSRFGTAWTIGGVARLVIFWRRPYHLSADEACDWACDQVSRLVRPDTVRHAELTAVRAVSGRHPSECEWMLELHLVPGRDAHDFVDAPAAAAWLADLRQLRLEPRVILVDGGISVHPERA